MVEYLEFEVISRLPCTLPSLFTCRSSLIVLFSFVFLEVGFIVEHDLCYMVVSEGSINLVSGSPACTACNTI
jgi:hypothetical protein